MCIQNKQSSCSLYFPYLWMLGEGSDRLASEVEGGGGNRRQIWTLTWGYKTHYVIYLTNVHIQLLSLGVIQVKGKKKLIKFTWKKQKTVIEIRCDDSTGVYINTTFRANDLLQFVFPSYQTVVRQTYKHDIFVHFVYEDLT